MNQDSAALRGGNLNFVEQCAECERLSAEYESATLEWFRLQSQLTITEYSQDERAADVIIAELSEIARRRSHLRDLTQAHLERAHPKVIGAKS